MYDKNNAYAHTPPVTRYNITFHDYETLAVDRNRYKEDSDTIPVELLATANTLTIGSFVTPLTNNFSPRYFFNSVMADAHDRIDEKEHPFSAWMAALHLDVDKIEFYTGLTSAQCEALAGDEKNNYKMPDAKHIRQFCDLTGVHPAHFEPGIKQKHFGYRVEVFKAIVDVYKDPNTLQADRELCLHAMRAEYHRYQDMCRYYKGAPFLRWFDDADTTANQMLKKMQRDFESVPLSLQGRFALSTDIRFIDGNSRLDCLLAVFDHAARGYTDQQVKFEIKARKENRELLGYASLFYGEDNEQAAISKILKAIDKATTVNGKKIFIGEGFWQEMEEDIFADLIVDIYGYQRENNAQDSRYDLPKFAPDCIERIEDNGDCVATVKDEFIETLKFYCELLEKIPKARYLAHVEFRKVRELETWRDKFEDARSLHIPIYNNICLMKAAVPELNFTQKALPSPAPQKV